LNMAHTFGTGGPDIEMLLLAVALLFLGVTFFVQKSTKPAVPVVLLVSALAVGAGAFAIGAASDSSTAAEGTLAPPEGLAVEIVAPSDGDTVPARETLELEVEIEGGELTSATSSEDPTQGHLHVYVDETLTSMPATTSQRYRLEPGEHTLAVEFTTADHRSFDPRIIDEITVSAE